MKRKHDEIETIRIPCLPREILCIILSLVPYSGKNWLNCRLVCSLFRDICTIIQDPRVNDDAPLLSSCHLGNSKSVANLLKDKRVDPTIYSNLPLRLAVKRGHAQIVHILLGCPRVLPTVSGPERPEYECADSAITLACNSFDISTVIEIARSPRVVEAEHFTALLRWITDNDWWQGIQALRENPNFRYTPGSVYFGEEHLFPFDNDLMIGQLICMPGLEKEKKCSFLYDKALAGHVLSVKKILQDPEVDPLYKPGLSRYTVLSGAAIRGNAAVVKMLLEDERAYGRGSTAFEDAVRSGSVEIVGLFVNDPHSSPSPEGLTAGLYIAIVNGFYDIFQFLAAIRPVQKQTLISRVRKEKYGWWAGDFNIAKWIVDAFFECLPKKVGDQATKLVEIGKIDVARLFWDDVRFSASEKQKKYISRSLKSLE